MIDSHCHLLDAQFNADREAAMSRASIEGILAMVEIGMTVEGSRRDA